MFTIRQKLLLCGSVLISALMIAGSYFGSRWLHGPDVEPLPEHLLSDRPHAVSTNRPVRAFVSQYAPSVFESQSVIDVDSTPEAEQNYDDEEEELETLLNSLSDEELTALAEAVEQDDGKSSDFPEVPEGFPSNLTPIWVKYPNYQKGDMQDHENIYRVLIKLWNQGDRGFVNGVYEDDKVYPLYRDVVYVKWRTEVSSDGVEFPYISQVTATHARGDPEVGIVGAGLFTVEEMISGAYKTKYPGLKLVAYEDAGYDPETFLNDE